MSVKKSIDVVVWGATGFTGQLICEHLVTKHGSDIAIVLGGRNAEKLGEIRGKLLAENPKAKEISVRIADLNNKEQLAKVFEDAKVCISAAGPFSKVGIPVVEACISAKTHYCDITGETPFVRKSIDMFHDKAAKAGVKIVHCCGFDSIPSDLGTLFLAGEAAARGKKLDEVKFYLGPMSGGVSGGTIASMINIMDNPREAVRCAKNPYYLVDDATRTAGGDKPDIKFPKFDKDLNLWVAPFIMSFVNTRIVRRSNSLLPEPYSSKFKYSEFMLTRSMFGAFQFWLFLTLAMVAMRIPFTRKLLEKYLLPKPGTGPTLEQRQKGFFKAFLWGRTEDGQVIKAAVSGGEPGYAQTSEMVAEAGICLLRGFGPTQSGVLTPASAMGMPLINALANRRMRFEIVDKFSVYGKSI